MVFLNIFVAVIVEAFNDINSNDKNKTLLSLNQTHLKNFRESWAKFNPNGDHYMKTRYFPAFLLDLPQPLGYAGKKLYLRKLLKIIYCMNIKDHGGRVYFPEVLWTICHSLVGCNDEDINKSE